MDPEEMTSEQRAEHEAAIREMVLSIALRLSVDVVDRASAAGLSSATLKDEVDAAGLRWLMRATFYGEPMTVQIHASGHPILDDAESEAVELPGQPGVLFVPQREIARLFTGQGGNAQFEFLVPVAWLRAAESARAPS